MLKYKLNKIDRCKKNNYLLLYREPPKKLYRISLDSTQIENVV